MLMSALPVETGGHDELREYKHPFPRKSLSIAWVHKPVIALIAGCTPHTSR